jgi:hypothetical protein
VVAVVVVVLTLQMVQMVALVVEMLILEVLRVLVLLDKVTMVATQMPLVKPLVAEVVQAQSVAQEQAHLHLQ